MTETRREAGLVGSFVNLLEKALALAVGLLMAAIVLLVFANVIARYFLAASIGWSEEVSRFLFIWLAFLGAVLAFLRHEHLGLDALVRALPARASKALVVSADVLVLIALSFITKGGIEMTADSLRSGWVSSAIPIPYGYVYLAVPISSGLMLLLGLGRTAVHLRAAPPGAAGRGKAC